MAFADDFAMELSYKIPKEFYQQEHFHVLHGRKYDRIILDRAVYAFVDKRTGELMKADGYNTPAKDSNGESFKKYFLNTAEGFQLALHNADRHGSFLYHHHVIRPLPAE